MTTAIILAGGLGTRLRSRIGESPKPMAPVGGRPFIAYLLDRLSRSGYTQVILSVGFRAELIEGALGNRYDGMSLIYSFEDRPLGTGGAMARALKQCLFSTATVLNGDTYVEVDYRDFREAHARSGAPLSMVLREVPDVARFGSVAVADGVVTGFNEKGKAGQGWINAGIYQVERDLFDAWQLPTVFSFESDFLMPHCAELRPQAWPTHGYMIDIGIPEDYDRAQVELPARADTP